MLDLVDRDPGGERGDRLVAQRLVDRRQRQSVGVASERLPLVRVLRQQPHRVGELALASVDSADEDVEHEVAKLVVAQPVALLLGGDEVGDQILARCRAPRLDQRVLVLVELRDRLLDQFALADQAGRVELALDPVRPVMQPRRVRKRRAHHLGDHQRWVRLGEVLDELTTPVRRERVEQLL